MRTAPEVATVKLAALSVAVRTFGEDGGGAVPAVVELVTIVDRVGRSDGVYMAVTAEVTNEDAVIVDVTNEEDAVVADMTDGEEAEGEAETEGETETETGVATVDDSALDSVCTR